MAISRNKKQPTAKKSRVKNATITDLADFDPETTIVIDGDANFADYPEITDLGNLQKITGDGNFENSQVLNLGNLQTIGWIADFQNSKIITLGNLQTIVGFADFRNSQVQDLGNLQTIEGDAYFSNSQVQSLGNLQTIGGYANFENSKIESLGNLQTIRRNAYFNYSKVQDLGNLQTIGGDAFFGGSQIQSLGELQTIGGGAYFWYSKIQSLGNLQTIGGDADFKNSKVKNLGNLPTIGRGANFFDSQVKDLGNLQTIGGDADFYESQVQNLGNLQTIRGSAFFEESQVQNLGNLQTIGGKADFGNRTDLEAEWKARQGEMNYADGGGVGLPKYLVYYMDNDGRKRIVDSGLTYQQAVKKSQQLVSQGVSAEYGVEKKYAKGGGVGNFPPKGELKNKENLLLKYEKIGSDYEFFVYKPEKKDVSSYEQIKYVCVNKDCPTRMSYNQFLNYLYAETYLDDRKYANGGGVEIPKNKSLRHFILNEMSDGMIANRTPFSDYATIDKIRIQAVQILNRDGDREYSMQSVSDLIQEALLEYEENKNYADGGGVGLKREKEKLTNLAYQLQNADEGWIRNNHSKFVQMLNDYKNQFKKVYGHSNYENPNNYADGGGVGMPNVAWFVFQEKFPEAFEYYLKNNEYGVSKGDLMAMAYESTRGVDSAIPTGLWKQVDNTMFYVYDYQNSSFGELVDLREKIKTSEVPVALSFVIDRHGYYGDDLPNELKNADFATALMYVYANRDVIDEFQIRPKRNVDNYADGGGVGVKKYEIRDYNDIYEGRYDEQGLIDWAKEYAQSRKEIIYINSVEDAKMYIESPDKNGNQNFEIYEYAKGGGVGGKDFVVEIYSTNFENTLIAERTFKTEKAAIRYAYSVEDLNDDGFYFNIFGLDKNGKNLIKVFGLIEAEEDLIRQNPKYKNCISWKLDMGVHSYPNNKTIFSKTFSRLDKALELAISLENESLSATINNLHYTTFIYANGGGVGQFNIGQSVMIAENNDNENYDDFRGKELVIYHKATNEKEHRGFDNSMEGQALYSFFLRETGEQVPFSCYDYELEQY